MFSQLRSLEYLSYFDKVKSAIPHDSNKGSSSTSCSNYSLKSLPSYLSSSSNRKWVSQASTITCPSLDARVCFILICNFTIPIYFSPDEDLSSLIHLLLTYCRRSGVKEMPNLKRISSRKPFLFHRTYHLLMKRLYKDFLKRGDK